MSDASVKCLLVHGMTASPRQLGPLQKDLKRAGYTVHAPILSGHGTQVDALIGLRWEDWYADILREVTLMNAPVFYAGISFGALLGLKLAIDRPDLLLGLVCIGTPLTLLPWMRVLYQVINYTPLRWMVRLWPKNFALAVADPIGRELYRQSSYPQFPLAVVREVRRLQTSIRHDLHRVTTPVLMMHARRDFTAPNEAMAMVANHVRGPVERVWLERSYHVATLDYERDLISQKTIAFLHERLSFA